MGQLHAVEFGREGGPDEAGLGEGPDTPGDLRQDMGPVRVQCRLDPVGGLVVRQERILGQAPGEVDHGIERLAAMVGEAVARAQRVHPQPFMQQEGDVAAVEDR